MAIYDVRVLDGDGNHKSTITAETIKARFWKAHGIAKPYRAPKDHGSGVCDQCERTFKKVQEASKYCKRPGIKASQQCGAIANRERQKFPKVAKNCPRCLRDFEGTETRVFCNDPCRS